jgi:hypothetical protein
MPFRRVVALCLLLFCPLLAHAQAQPSGQPRTGVIQGAITTQSTVNLPGAQIVVADNAGKQIAQSLSGEDGHFNFVGLAPGRYKLTASFHHS